MLIRSASQWAFKPPPGAQVNYAHPSSRGLLDVVLWNEGSGVPREAMRNELLVQGWGGYPAPVWNMTQLGPGKLFNGSREALAVPNKANDKRSMTGDITVLFSFLTAMSTSQDAWKTTISKRFQAGANCAWGHHYNAAFSGGSHEFFWGKTSTYQVVRESNYKFPVGSVQIVGFTRGPGRRASLYRDGVVRASIASSTQVADDPYNDPILFGGGSTGESIDNLTFLWYYAWTRELQAEEIRELTLQPYSLLQPAVHRVFIAAPASGWKPYFSQQPQPRGILT